MWNTIRLDRSGDRWVGALELDVDGDEHPVRFSLLVHPECQLAERHALPGTGFPMDDDQRFVAGPQPVEQRTLAPESLARTEEPDPAGASGGDLDLEVRELRRRRDRRSIDVRRAAIGDPSELHAGCARALAAQLACARLVVEIPHLHWREAFQKHPFEGNRSDGVFLRCRVRPGGPEEPPRRIPVRALTCAAGGARLGSRRARPRRRSRPCRT